VKFLIDNQLPTALARHIIAKGHEAEHVLNIGLAEAKDAQICQYAESNALVIVTKDEDFSRLASRPGAVTQVVWIRFGNCRKPVLIAAFDLLLPSIISALEAGERLIEIR
jgi:predicted nuclease of predicted toxin-antitoxin system